MPYEIRLLGDTRAGQVVSNLAVAQTIAEMAAAKTKMTIEIREKTEKPFNEGTHWTFHSSVLPPEKNTTK